VSTLSGLTTSPKEYAQHLLESKEKKVFQTLTSVPNVIKLFTAVIYEC
jgi:hypothetical protein